MSKYFWKYLLLCYIISTRYTDLDKYICKIDWCQATVKIPEQKVILCGEYGVGKSSLFRRFMADTFTTATDRKSTMGLDHYSKVQPPPFNISRQNVALRSIVNSARCTTWMKGSWSYSYGTRAVSINSYTSDELKCNRGLTLAQTFIIETTHLLKQSWPGCCRDGAGGQHHLQLLQAFRGRHPRLRTRQPRHLPHPLAAPAGHRHLRRERQDISVRATVLITPCSITTVCCRCGNKFDQKNKIQISDSDMEAFCEQCHNLVSGMTSALLSSDHDGSLGRHLQDLLQERRGRGGDVHRHRQAARHDQQIQDRAPSNRGECYY